MGSASSIGSQKVHVDDLSNTYNKNKKPLSPNADLNTDTSSLRDDLKNEYIGERDEDGKKHGIGTMYYSNGSSFEGQWERGKIGKHGSYRYATTGSVYEGEFLDGKQNGKGKITFENGDIYEGDWVNGKRKGYGEYYFNITGDKYCGNYNDLADGEGTYTFANGDRYVGQFNRGQCHGQGTYYYLNGDQYVGDFFVNKFDGHGKFIYSNGEYFEGLFQVGKIHGTGVAKIGDVLLNGECKEDKFYG
jgi:hypothetical protein